MNMYVIKHRKEAIFRGDGGSGDATGNATITEIQNLTSDAQQAKVYSQEWANKAEDSLVSTDAGGDGVDDYSALHQANKAQTSATNASTSATNAATSATNAATSETNSATSETNALASENAAATSASNAATSETNAASSASAASTSETNAASSASAASTSETNAAASASAASTSETNAATSETNAATSETNAAASASAASTSETNAATSASAASTSETNAATSETNAANSATAAAISYDNFDDRYLGDKASDPTLDNDGNALLDGALYWNTTATEMRVYNLGTTSWEPASNISKASTSEAEAGADDSKYMTPLKTAEAISAIPRKNYIINGNFDIWQRGTSFTAAGYTADRWLSDDGDGAFTVSRQSFTLGQTDVPGEPKFYLRHNQSTASTVSYAIIQQRVEGVRSYAGQSITISFYAKSGASKTLTANIAQNFGTGGTPSTEVITAAGSVGLTTSWQKFTFTVSVPSISGKTIGSNDDDYLSFRILEDSSFSTFTLDIAQVQLEQGNVATNFEYRPIGEEWALCQRYYEKSNMLLIATARRNSTTNLSRATQVYYKQIKRTAPSVSFIEAGVWASTPAMSSTEYGSVVQGDAAAALNTTTIDSWAADAEL